MNHVIRTYLLVFTNDLNNVLLIYVRLVDRAFGGKIRTTYTCGKCSTVSLHKETFTVLHLAIPVEEDKSEKVLYSLSPPNRAMSKLKLIVN